MVEAAEAYITLRRNPEWPTATDPRRRFDKPWVEAPWAGALEATIYLDDPVWELLGWAHELKVTIKGV